MPLYLDLCYGFCTIGAISAWRKRKTTLLSFQSFWPHQLSERVLGSHCESLRPRNGPQTTARCWGQDAPWHTWTPKPAWTQKFPNLSIWEQNKAVFMISCIRHKLLHLSILLTQLLYHWLHTSQNSCVTGQTASAYRLWAGKAT